MAYNSSSFGNSADERAPAETSSPDATDAPESEAMAKFRSCRWRRPPEEGPECCGHRDVLPLAGTADFNPEAWCPDCEYYKLRRSPRRRAKQDYW